MTSNRLCLVSCLAAIAVLAFGGGSASDTLTQRKAAWQAVVNRPDAVFHFDQSHAGMLYSLSQFQGNCQIAMIYDPAKWWEITFKLMRGDTNLATLLGDTQSCFVGTKTAFYFAQFSDASCGCNVLAFDTTTGKKKWERKLLAAGDMSHSVYNNQVTIELTIANPTTAATLPSELTSLVVTGSEMAGNYTEILDAETGTLLAHRIFR